MGYSGMYSRVMHALPLSMYRRLHLPAATISHNTLDNIEQSWMVSGSLPGQTRLLLLRGTRSTLREALRQNLQEDRI